MRSIDHQNNRILSPIGNIANQAESLTMQFNKSVLSAGEMRNNRNKGKGLQK